MHQATAACNAVVDAEGEALPGLRAHPHPAGRRRPQRPGAFAEAEAAKRRLVFQLLDLGLPVDGGDLRPALEPHEPVTTGHADGVITIDLAEGDTAPGARAHDLGEPYRTVLGHLRHEVGHYYWPSS